MRNNNGSALLATLMLTGVISLLMMTLALMVNAQGRVNRQHAQHQTSRAEVERFAEETYATYSPLMSHDGTLNDHHLPRRGQGLITAETTHTLCSRSFTANPTLIETGVITVTMNESCDGTPGRQEKLTYLLSPDTDAVISLLANEPTQPLNVTSFSRTSAVPTPTFLLTVTSSERGYVRAVIEGPDLNSPQRKETILANQPISPGSGISITFPDEFPSTGDRHLKLLFSEQPFSSDPDDLIRWTCPDGICGAQSVHRIRYTITGSYAAVPPPTN